MKGITIYTKDLCPYCDRAKALLTSLGVSFSEVNLEDQPELRAELSEKHHWRTVPMIIAGEKFLGGFDDILALHRRGELLPLLA